jgi:hypothetical protein
VILFHWTKDTQLFFYLYSASDAIEIECSLIDEYRNNGFNVLNIVKGGGLGGKINLSQK